MFPKQEHAGLHALLYLHFPADKTEAMAAPALILVPTALSNTEALSLATISGACIAVLANTTSQGDGAPLVASLAFSGLAFSLTYALVRWLGNVFMRAGLKGKDMSKARGGEMYVTFFLYV